MVKKPRGAQTGSRKEGSVEIKEADTAAVAPAGARLSVHLSRLERNAEMVWSDSGSN